MLLQVYINIPCVSVCGGGGDDGSHACFHNVTFICVGLKRGITFSKRLHMK